MSRGSLIEELARRPLLCDGAMGTQLMARGLAAGSVGEQWNVERPDQVEDIHRCYREAGCELITTNTFGGSAPALGRHGLDGQVAEVNSAASRIARRAVGDTAWVLGDVGPFGGFLEPIGDMTPEELLRIFREQVAALYDGGADGVVIETMSDPAEVAVAIKAAKLAGPKAVIATYAFERGDGKTFRTMMGNSAADAARATIDAGADVVGANCGTSLGLEDYIRLAADLVKAAGKTPVILQPNAGSPRTDGGRLEYPASPEEMGQLVPQLLGVGVRIIGGCCGTTPDHLRAMGKALRAAKP